MSSVVEGRAEAYRNGGDEVVVIAPQTDAEAARKMVTQVLTALANERVEGLAAPITAACGIVTTIDATTTGEELLAVMYAAKTESKKHTPRPSTLSVEGGAWRS